MRHKLAWRGPQDQFTLIYKAIKHTGRTLAEMAGIQLIALCGVHKHIQLFIQKRIQPFGDFRSLFVLFPLILCRVVSQRKKTFTLQFCEFDY